LIREQWLRELPLLDPHSRWRTTTMASALRLSGETAAKEVEGASDGLEFREYVQSKAPYDFVSVDDEGLGKYRPKTFNSLLTGLQRYKKNEICGTPVKKGKVMVVAEEGLEPPTPGL
jgi:hypothetical protein